MTDKFINNKPLLTSVTSDYFNEISKIIGDKVRFICDDGVIQTVFISPNTPLSQLLELSTHLEVLDSCSSNLGSISFSELSQPEQKTFCRTIKLVIDLSTDKAPLVDPEHLKILLERQ